MTPRDQELQGRLEAILNSPSYRLAELDTDLLQQPDLRPVRVQLELLKPELAFEEQRIHSTIVAFGGTQIVERSEATARLELENDLRLVLHGRQLRLFYQPIVCLGTGEIRSFEALLRWQHPDRGLILPAAFIPIAEETGLIIPIGQWVLREACEQLRVWNDQMPTGQAVSMNVNVPTTFSEGIRTIPAPSVTLGTIRSETGLANNEIF